MARTKVFDEEVVLNKALDLFWRKGYNGTSAQDLVDTLGISRSSLYDTYGSKYELFKRSLLYYRKKFSGSMIDIIEKSDDVIKTIKDIFQYILTDSIEDKFLKGCFITNCTIELAPHNVEIAAIVESTRKDVEDALLRAIKKGQESGQISKDQSAISLARFVVNTISGLRVATKSGADKKVFEDIIDITMHALK